MLSAMNELVVRCPAASRPAALAVGGQTPTTVPIPGGLAVTVSHPAVADLGLHEVHAAQCEILRDELGDGFAPCEIWDWVLRQLGGGPFHGLWPGDPAPVGFGEPIATGSSVGVNDGSHGLAKGTVLVPASADAFMGFWACGAYRPGVGHDPGGRTGGLGLAVASDSVRDDMFSMPSAVQDVSIVGGPVNGHGRLLEWWASLSGLSIAAVLAKAAQVPPGAEGVLVLPYIAVNVIPAGTNGSQARYMDCPSIRVLRKFLGQCWNRLLMALPILLRIWRLEGTSCRRWHAVDRQR